MIRRLASAALAVVFLAACATEAPLPPEAATTPSTQPPPAFAGKRPTREEAADRFNSMGVQPGQTLPLLDLIDLDGNPVDLTAARGGRPAVIVTCSLTCNVARRQKPGLADLLARVGNEAFIALVYTIDAHPKGDPCPYTGEEWVPTPNNQDDVLVRQPTTLAERLTLARRYARDWSGGVPVFVDTMDNTSWRALGEAPNVGICTDKAGVVVARTGWCDLAAITAALGSAR